MKFPMFDGLRSSGKRAQNTGPARAGEAVAHRPRAVRGHRAKHRRARAGEGHGLLNGAAARAHDAALEALRVSRDSFDQGLITSLDLLQAERAERQAESQRRHAELGLWSARFDQRRSLRPAPTLTPGPIASEILNKERRHANQDDHLLPDSGGPHRGGHGLSPQPAERRAGPPGQGQVRGPAGGDASAGGGTHLPSRRGLYRQPPCGEPCRTQRPRSRAA